MPFYVACDYDKPDLTSYRGIVLIDTDTNEVVKRFYSGNFDEDYRTYQVWLYENEPFFFENESVTAFINKYHGSNEMSQW
ncbi:hypothetical protein WD019_18320 [Fictibacillus sp. Mic-4]|uniref:hypothetical protein n=1 Tax=Fictibacillus TaxID=1329200 RepID=UPI0004275841|nr:hypothetical protein [Fictibacillus gelatini]